jgi:NitT/TauT family transport system substrate-binding protein
MTVKKLIAALIVAPFIALAAGQAVAKEKIRVGIAVSWPGYAFLKLIEERNLAPDYELEITIFEDPIQGHNLLAAGQLDIYGSTLDYIPIAIEQGFSVVNVAYTNPSYGVDQVVLSPGIKASELKGKKVAAPEAFIGQLQVGMWLDMNGLKPDDVSWVNLNADEGVGPMISGDIAAAYMYEPWTSKLMESVKGVQIVADTSQDAFKKTGIFGDSLYMHKDFIKNNRKAAVALLKARWDALQIWHDKTEETNNFFAEYLQWPKEDIPYVMGTNGKFFLGGIYMFDFDESAQFCGVLDGEPPFGKHAGFEDAVKLTNEWWVKLGVMQKMQDPEAGIDCSLMGDLVKQGYRQSFAARE